MPVLTREQIAAELTRLPGWSLAGDALQRQLEFPDFASAMAFVNRIAEAAEQADHHPDIDIRYNRVVLSLVSHDAGGITARDVRMAATINELLS